MELIVLDKPTEFYANILFNCDDDLIEVFCFTDQVDLVHKSRRLVMRMRYFGFDFENLEIKEDLQTKSGTEIKKPVFIFTLKRGADLIKRKNELDKDKEIRLTKQAPYKDHGKMIYLKKKILHKLKENSTDPNEDYNDIVERVIDGKVHR